MLSSYLTKKVENITSSIFTYILLWATKLRIPMCTNPKHNCHCSYGLRTLLHSERMKSRSGIILHRHNVPPAAAETEKTAAAASSLSSWLWPSSPRMPVFQMGDVIGTESGDCMMSEVPEQAEADGESQWQRFSSAAWREKNERWKRIRERELPPPITPRNFTREWIDGRLILRAEAVPQEEDDDVDDDGDDGSVICEECGWRMDFEEEEEEDGVGFDGVDFDGGIEGFDEDEEELTNGKGVARFESESESESEIVRCGVLRHSVSTSAIGLVRDSESFWKGLGDGPSGFLGRPGSAPLRPITSVM